MATSLCPDSPFTRKANVLANNKSPAIIFYKDQSVPVVFKHTHPLLSTLVDHITRELRCRECATRVKAMGGLSNSEMPLLFTGSSDELEDLSRKIFREGEVVGATVVRGPYLLDYPPYVGGFTHYYVDLRDTPTVDSSTAQLLDKAIVRYVPQELPALLEMILADPSGMLDSVSLLKSLLPKASYGVTIEPAVDWLKCTIQLCMDENPKHMSAAKRWRFCIQILFRTSIIGDGVFGRNAVSPIIQQTRNMVLDLLSSARNEKAMVAMLADRLSPLHYQRPTSTTPSAGSVDLAERVLGNFVNTMMTQDEVLTLGDFVLDLRYTTSGAAAAFSRMKKKIKPASSFASRCTKTLTIKDLTELIRQHPGRRLKIRTLKLTPTYLAKTSLSQECLSVPFFWSFLNSRTPCDYSIPEWATVDLIVQAYNVTPRHKNIFFILSDFKPLKSVPNCCFPGFLSSSLQRELRTPFENLNRDSTFQLTIPTTSKLAFGVGTSVTDYSKFMTPIEFSLDGVTTGIVYSV